MGSSTSLLTGRRSGGRCATNDAVAALLVHEQALMDHRSFLHPFNKGLHGSDKASSPPQNEDAVLLFSDLVRKLFHTVCYFRQIGTEVITVDTVCRSR
ncbi:hypothetical protein EV561_1378 [Rhizobium sp. BK376]|nr:hypothetical protein EV561_1378 [Rhizobium sp. BK376]